MKQISLIISIVALVAVVVLFIINYTGNGKKAQDEVKQPVQKSNSGLKIAYVKADSVILNYDLAQDLHDEFTRKQEAYTNEYATKRTSFEKDAAAFQEKLNRGGFLTEQRAIQERDRLVNWEQEILQLDQELSGKLADIQTTNNSQLLDSLLNYLNKLNETRQYDYILNGGEVLIGDEANNITAEVLKGMNERYNKFKQGN
ncbi:MAG: OmpH family outer membrane protein [Prolixibacteraceae bacterium]|nr:OmpH family outer membrane protein [Prolixibacteraceae bacterium]MBN2773631.1 OmpH family outer membrane protein [Prolixibacteraceae bacterium]